MPFLVVRLGVSTASKVVIFTITQRCAGMGSPDSRTPNRPPQWRLTVMPPSLAITQINAIMDRIEQPARNSDADSSG